MRAEKRKEEKGGWCVELGRGWKNGKKKRENGEKEMDEGEDITGEREEDRFEKV